MALPSSLSCWTSARTSRGKTSTAVGLTTTEEVGASETGRMNSHQYAKPPNSTAAIAISATKRFRPGFLAVAALRGCAGLDWSEGGCGGAGRGSVNVALGAGALGGADCRTVAGEESTGAGCLVWDDASEGENLVVGGDASRGESLVVGGVGAGLGGILLAGVGVWVGSGNFVVEGDES